MTDNNKSVLETTDLRVAVADKLLCQDLNWTVNRGEIWCVLGRNGAGKTLLLHTLAGLRAAQDGSISLGGQALGSLSRKEVARNLGILFQDHADPFPSTVLETVLTGRHPHLGIWGWETNQDRELAQQSLETVGLTDFAQRNVASLSGGERRRLGIATLLTQQTALSLWDEPTNHLDLHHQIEILTHIQHMAHENGSTHIMVLHDLNLAARFADHFLLLLGNGEYRAGTADDVMQQSLLEQAYGHTLIPVENKYGTAWLAG